MEEIKYQVRIDQTAFETFIVETGLKLEDAYYCLTQLFEKAVREMQKEATGIKIGQQKIQILSFEDDLNIKGNARDDIEKATKIPDNPQIKQV